MDGGFVLHGIGSNLLLYDGVLVVVSLGSSRCSVTNDLDIGSSIIVVIRCSFGSRLSSRSVLRS